VGHQRVLDLPAGLWPARETNASCTEAGFGELTTDDSNRCIAHVQSSCENITDANRLLSTRTSSWCL
jgi:hypothetical protein